jgi:hypothetical protein
MVNKSEDGRRDVENECVIERRTRAVEEERKKLDRIALPD